MPADTPAVKLSSKRSRSKSLRRQMKRKKVKGLKPPRPEPANDPSDAGRRTGWVASIELCRTCNDLGIYTERPSSDGPALVRYCTCRIGTRQLSTMIEIIKATRP